MENDENLTLSVCDTDQFILIILGIGLEGFSLKSGHFQPSSVSRRTWNDLIIYGHCSFRKVCLTQIFRKYYSIDISGKLRTTTSHLWIFKNKVGPKLIDGRQGSTIVSLYVPLQKLVADSPYDSGDSLSS